MLTGARPVYMVPTRNRYGIIGPISPSEMDPKTIQAKAKASPLTKKVADQKPVYAVVTNSTYDGLCYNSARVEALLAKSSDRIHMDEAWYGYARFNPMYENHFAMRGDPATHKGPTVFATHSTHKLLAAFSQASYIHVRDGKGAIDHHRFNQAYMMHTSTSPLYAIVASNDITSAMMDGSGGRSLTQEVIDEAVDFRQAVGRVRREFAKKKDWFFKPWNVETVKGPGGKKVPFEDAPAELLTREPGAVDPAPRRQVARLRRHRRRLVHARPDQGQHPLARAWARTASSRRRGVPGGAGQRLVQPLRHRADARHRLPGDVPVLDRHHARASGARCSPTCSPSSATTTRTARSPHSLPEIAAQYPERYGKHRHARPRRRAVRVPAREPPRRGAERRLREACPRPT